MTLKTLNLIVKRIPLDYGKKLFFKRRESNLYVHIVGGPRYVWECNRGLKYTFAYVIYG